MNLHANQLQPGNLFRYNGRHYVYVVSALSEVCPDTNRQYLGVDPLDLTVRTWLGGLIEVELLAVDYQHWYEMRLKSRTSLPS